MPRLLDLEGGRARAHVGEVTAYGEGEGGCCQPIREHAGEKGFLSSRVGTTPNDDTFYHVDFYND